VSLVLTLLLLCCCLLCAAAHVAARVDHADAVVQLLDCIEAELEAAAAASSSAAAMLPPVFYISPAAADRLATANSCCEYLEPSRQMRVLSCGEAPFAAERMAAAGRLRLLLGGSAGGARAEGAPAASDSGAAASWQADVQQVLQAGPCIALVPLWSLAGGEWRVSCCACALVAAACTCPTHGDHAPCVRASAPPGPPPPPPLCACAGPGAMLAHGWSSSDSNMLLLPEPQAVGCEWRQQCVQAGLLPAGQQQWQWQVLHAAPGGATLTILDSLTGSSSSSSSSSSSARAGTGGRHAASSTQHSSEGSLTADELVGLLSSSGSSSSSSVEGAGGGSACCRVVASDRDGQLLVKALVGQEKQHSRRVHMSLLGQLTMRCGRVSTWLVCVCVHALMCAAVAVAAAPPPSPPPPPTHTGYHP
jgi:hypothetical protein